MAIITERGYLLSLLFDVALSMLHAAYPVNIFNLIITLLSLTASLAKPLIIIIIIIIIIIRQAVIKKAIPLQARTGPECSRRLRLLDIKTIGS
jgi:hypothetical protein